MPIPEAYAPYFEPLRMVKSSGGSESNLISVVREFCRNAEYLFDSGSEKHNWVVEQVLANYKDSIVEKLNKAVNVPLLNEEMEAVVIGFVIDAIIYTIIGLYNESGITL